MKKFISLALSLIMIMSLVAVPVMAEDAVVDETPEAPVVVTPATASVDPSIWVQAAHVEDYMDAEYGGYYCNNSEAKDENGAYVKVGNEKYHRYKWYNGTYPPSNGSYAAFDKMNPQKPAYLFIRHGSVYDAKTAAEGTEAWEGFKLTTASTSTLGSASDTTGSISVNNRNKDMYAGKDIRVDSLRFKMDTYNSSSWVALLGLSDKWSTSTIAYQMANDKTAIIVQNGGVKYYKVDSPSASPSTVELLPAKTLSEDTWYRIEKAADIRVDAGATAEVWQRAIIYVDETNEVLGDTGWVWTKNWTKPDQYANGTATHPFVAAGSAAGKFPSGSCVYFDDLKSWAVDTPDSSILVGDGTNTGIPSDADVTLDTTIKTDAASLESGVKLYKGSVDVSDMISSLTYDAETNKVNITFTALEPAATYTVKFERFVAEVESNIFSVIPTTEGYTFTTGNDGAISLLFTQNFKTMGVTLEDAGQFVAGSEIVADPGTTLRNYFDTPSSYVVIAAIYDEDGRMEDMMSQVGTIEGKATIDVDFGGDTLMPENATTLKAFVWNTWRLMQPIANHYVYSAE